MELRHIRYFIRAAEFLHFTRAAESLYVSQSTLSVHIRQLEDELGSSLFDRVGRRVQLTEAGEILLIRARSCLRELEHGRAEIAELRGLLRGTLRIGSTHVFSQIVVSTSLGLYAAAYPQVHVLVNLGTALDVERRILEGAVDLGLTYLPEESPDIESEPLFSDEIVLAVSKKHPLASRKELSTAELDELPLVLPSTGFRARRIIDLQFAKEKITPTVLIELNDISGVLSIVEAGRLGGIVTRMSATARPGVHIISLGKTGLTLAGGILKRRDVRLSAAAEAFVKVFREQMKSRVP